MEPQPVIYFDGVCNLCTGSVQFILKHDRKKIFRFASLQGEAGQKMLISNDLPKDQFKTVILEQQGKIFTGSTAALNIAKHLGGVWPLLYGFIIIPSFIRDAIYNVISNNRYKWFGKKETCWVPGPGLNHRFLK